MKFKDLFEKKNLTRVIILAIVIFLLLPLIFPEKTELKIIRKESVYPHEDSPLPIFPKESLLDKYANKFKKFYHLNSPASDDSKNNDTNRATKSNLTKLQPEIIDETETEVKNRNEYIDIDAGDLFFSADYDDEDDNSHATKAEATTPDSDEDNSVNLNKGTVLTRDGMLLEPTQEGYYYKSKFYKNGTYPPNANKRHIEGALSRYHSRIAKNLGKKALYLADAKGNLTVSYVDTLPDESSTDIYTYLAKNRNTYQKIKSSKNTPRNTVNDQYNSYSNSRIANFDNEQIDNTDILLASIKSMHAAYSLLTEKIQSGQLGQGILPNPIGLIPLGGIILNQAAVAEPPIETPEDEDLCQNNDCKNSLKIAPIIPENDNASSSDLSSFYRALCDVEDNSAEHNSCSYGLVYDRNNIDLDLDSQNGINDLMEKVQNSDKTVIEISYINPHNYDYRALRERLDNMSLRNKNDAPVTVRLRGLSEVDDTSFGTKMISQHKHTIEQLLNADSENSTSNHGIAISLLGGSEETENPEVSYDAIVKKYDEVHQKAQDDIQNNINVQVYAELHPEANFDYPVAFIEKSADNDNVFIVNNPNIPRGYLNEIHQWQQYWNEEKSYYEIPRDVILNAPNDIVLIVVKEGDKRDLALNGRPIGIIKKENLLNLKYTDVRSNEFEIANAQYNMMIYNSSKSEGETMETKPE